MRILSLGVVCAGIVSMNGFNVTAQEAHADSQLQEINSLPGSLDRIRKQLDRITESGDKKDLLRLDYFIDVYGQLPEINIAEGFKLDTGPVRFSVPSTSELLNASTPQRYQRRFGVGFSVPR